jgi:hypothetical protein
MIAFWGIFLGAVFGFFMYLCMNKVYVQRSDHLKTMQTVHLLHEKMIKIESENRMLFNTNKYLGHNDIALNERITKMEENYAKDCSKKIEKTICGDVSARAEQYMASDQKSVQKELNDNT